MRVLAIAAAAALIATSAWAGVAQRQVHEVPLAPDDQAAVQAVEAMRQRVRVHAMNGRCDYAYSAARVLGDQALLAYVAEMCGTPPPPPPPPPAGTVRLWD